MTTPKRMGARIRKLRGKMTQAELAKRARVTREYVNKLEAGQYSPTVAVLTRLARALGVRVTELLE